MLIQPCVTFTQHSNTLRYITSLFAGLNRNQLAEYYTHEKKHKYHRQREGGNSFMRETRIISALLGKWVDSMDNRRSKLTNQRLQITFLSSRSTTITTISCPGQSPSPKGEPPAKDGSSCECIRDIPHTHFIITQPTAP